MLNIAFHQQSEALFQYAAWSPSAKVIHRINVYKLSSDGTFFHQKIMPRIMAIRLIFTSVLETALALTMIATGVVFIKILLDARKMEGGFSSANVKQVIIKYGMFAINSLALLVTSLFMIIFNKFPNVNYFSKSGMKLLMKENLIFASHFLKTQEKKIREAPGVTKLLLDVALNRYFLAKAKGQISLATEELSSQQREKLLANSIVLKKIKELILDILVLDSANSELWDMLKSARFGHKLAFDRFEKFAVRIPALANERTIQEITAEKDYALALDDIITQFKNQQANLIKKIIPDLSEPLLVDSIIMGYVDELGAFTLENLASLTQKNSSEVIRLLQKEEIFLAKNSMITDEFFGIVFAEYRKFVENAQKLPEAEISYKLNNLKEIMAEISRINPLCFGDLFEPYIGFHNMTEEPAIETLREALIKSSPFLIKEYHNPV